MRQRFQKGFQVALEFVVLSLTTSLALVVVLGVVFRKMGAALVWYDELASILLAYEKLLKPLNLSKLELLKTHEKPVPVSELDDQN